MDLIIYNFHHHRCIILLHSVRSNTIHCFGILIGRTLRYASYLHVFLFVYVSGCLLGNLLHVRWRWLPVVLHRVLWRQRGAALWKRQLLQVRNQMHTSHKLVLVPQSLIQSRMSFHKRLGISSRFTSITPTISEPFRYLSSSLPQQWHIGLPLATNCCWSANSQTI